MSTSCDLIRISYITTDNGLSPVPHQAIIWTNAGLVSFQSKGTNLIMILITIQAFSFKKMRWNDDCKMAANSSRPKFVKKSPPVCHAEKYEPFAV